MRPTIAKRNNDDLPALVPTSSPVLGFLGNATHGTVGYFSSGWPLAYLVATAIFGAALLVGSLVPVSSPQQVARQSVLPSTFGRGAGGEGSQNVTHRPRRRPDHRHGRLPVEE